MTYSMRFEMSQHPWNAAVIIFDDGQVKLHQNRLSSRQAGADPGRGQIPTTEQLELCRIFWSRAYEKMDFRVASFCPALQPFCRDIMEVAHA